MTWMSSYNRLLWLPNAYSNVDPSVALYGLSQKFVDHAMNREIAPKCPGELVFSLRRPFVVKRRRTERDGRA